jgi:hypothetical protein
MTGTCTEIVLATREFNLSKLAGLPTRVESSGAPMAVIRMIRYLCATSVTTTSVLQLTRFATEMQFNGTSAKSSLERVKKCRDGVKHVLPRMSGGVAAVRFF